MSKLSIGYPPDMLSPEKFGQGVDIVEIDRIGNLVDKWGSRFTNRIYTSHELAKCRGNSASLAARFAAKEAIVKAIGTGLRGMAWKDIEILNDQNGRPYFALHDRAAFAFNKSGWKSCTLSLTHSAGIAVAMVTVLKF